MLATSACTFTQTVIPTKCGIPGCHSGAFPPELSTDAMAAMAINEPMGATCAGDPTAKYLINSAAPVAGILIDRITGTLCGPLTQMPFSGTPLTQAEVDCIKSYYMSKIR
jgi:hypothetical protein